MDPVSMGFVATAIGGLAQAGGQIMAGNAANDAAKFEAREIERQAVASRAEGTHKAAEEARQRRLALSRAQLVGAASGGGRAYELEGDLAAEGEYRKLLALFEGNNRADGLTAQARGVRYNGKIARSAGFMKASGSLLNTGAGLYAKYGGSGPSGYGATRASGGSL